MSDAGKRIVPTFFFKKRRGITLVELMIAIAILMIITVISIVSFNSANKLSELRTATDELADNLRDLQVLAFSNIKEVEDPPGYIGPYELGYRYFFDKAEPNNIKIEYYEILSDSPVINSGVEYYLLTDKTLRESHKIIDIKTDDGVDITSHETFNLAYFFPEAEILFFGSDIITTQNTDDELIIYIKHEEVADWQGKVSVNQYSGRINSEVIEYNP